MLGSVSCDVGFARSWMVRWRMIHPFYLGTFQSSFKWVPNSRVSALTYACAGLYGPAGEPRVVSIAPHLTDRLPPPSRHYTVQSAPQPVPPPPYTAPTPAFQPPPPPGSPSPPLFNDAEEMYNPMVRSACCVSWVFPMPVYVPLGRQQRCLITLLVTISRICRVE